MSRRERRESIEQALGTVGLTSCRKHVPSQPSGGQQQGAAIARALVGEPKLILAGEPMGNLASAMARKTLDLLETINHQGTTIIMVTHDPLPAPQAGREIHLLGCRTYAHRIATRTL